MYSTNFVFAMSPGNQSYTSSRRGTLSQGLRTRFLGDLGQYTQEIVVLPTCKEAARRDTLPLAVLLRLEQAQRQLPHPCQILGTVAGPVPMVILTETDVQDPVQPVLDSPMAAHPVQILRCRPGDAADEVTDLGAGH